MRRLIATLACAATASTALAAPAHAQPRPTDPVSALKKQFVTGHGVRFNTVNTVDLGLAEMKVRQQTERGSGTDRGGVPPLYSFSIGA